VHDILLAEDLISGLPFENIVADKGYDSDRFRACIAEAGAEAVIPSIPARTRAIPYDKHVYKERNLVERFFNKIKHYRRIATRYEKTAISYAAMLFVVGAMVWLR
jgi:transposase